jgi:hypothetical protein
MPDDGATQWVVIQVAWKRVVPRWVLHEALVGPPLTLPEKF